MYANRRNSCVLHEICVEEHDGDGSGNMGVLHMRGKNTQYNPYYHSLQGSAGLL